MFDNKDRLGIMLSIVGFIVICIVYVYMRSSTGEDMSKQFGAGTYYTPATGNELDAKTMYAEYNLGKLNECNQTTLLKRNARSFARVDNHNSTIKNWILPETEYKSEYQNNIPSNIDSVCNVLQLDANFFNSTNEIRLLDLIKPDALSAAVTDRRFEIIRYSDESFADNEDGTGQVPQYVYELVAPFDFKFLNSNVDGTSDNIEIQIASTDGKYKIEFSKCLNWFCAGESFQPSNYETGGTKQSWLIHSHMTIIGSSINATVKSGGAGSLLGWGGDDTTMKIYKSAGDYWTPISVSQLICEQ